MHVFVIVTHIRTSFYSYLNFILLDFGTFAKISILKLVFNNSRLTHVMTPYNLETYPQTNQWWFWMFSFAKGFTIRIKVVGLFRNQINLALNCGFAWNHMNIPENWTQYFEVDWTIHFIYSKLILGFHFHPIPSPYNLSHA